MVQPNITFENTQKGVVPDVEIKESMQDIIDKKDTQLDWVKSDIQKTVKFGIKLNETYY